MDRPYKYLGKHHRVLFHDPLLAYMIARKQYPKDSNAIAAAQCHIAVDNMCTQNPEFKKILTNLARLSKNEKSGQATSTEALRSGAANPQFDGMRQLINLYNSPTTPSIDSVLVEHVAKSLRKLVARIGKSCG